MEKQSYNHEQYRPGLNVYIDPAIRQVHPLSPLAGEVVKTCTGNEYSSLDSGEQRSQVPVRYKGQIRYVEPEYIQVD